MDYLASARYNIKYNESSTCTRVYIDDLNCLTIIIICHHRDDKYYNRYNHVYHIIILMIYYYKEQYPLPCYLCMYALCLMHAR